jgi:mannosyltransferase OCH1-like enzyme
MEYKIKLLSLIRVRHIVYAALACPALFLGYHHLCIAQERRVIQMLKAAAEQQYVDFDAAMSTIKYQHRREMRHENVIGLLAFMKSLYAKNNLRMVTPTAVSKIPHIIHHIWLGSDLPQEYEGYYQSWHTQHPDWIFIFWTDNAANYDKGQEVIRSFDVLAQKLQGIVPMQRQIVVDVNALCFENRALFDDTPYYGERSDILKWEIVERFGGVYVDTDFECLKPLDLLHHMYDLYTGIQPLDTSFPGQLGAGIFAATPHHPVMKACVDTLAEGTHKALIIDRSGPLHFTRVFFEHAGKETTDVALPASYFYPCAYEQRGMPAQQWQRPESFAVHHWAGSWIKPEAVTSEQARIVHILKNQAALVDRASLQSLLKKP